MKLSRCPVPTLKEDSCDAVKFLIPELVDELWKESGHWQTMDLRNDSCKSRNDFEYTLGFTHEEELTNVICTKAFIMKGADSFDFVVKDIINVTAGTNKKIRITMVILAYNVVSPCP